MLLIEDERVLYTACQSWWASSHIPGVQHADEQSHGGLRSIYGHFSRNGLVDGPYMWFVAQKWTDWRSIYNYIYIYIRRLSETLLLTKSRGVAVNVGSIRKHFLKSQNTLFFKSLQSVKVREGYVKGNVKLFVRSTLFLKKSRSPWRSVKGTWRETWR